MKRELRNKIIELKQLGLKRKEIAEKLNITYRSVIYFLTSKEPIEKGHNDTYKGIIEDSKTMRNSELVKKYGVSRQYVSVVIKNGIKN